MDTINSSIAWTLDRLLATVEPWPPAASLTLVSLIVAGALLALFKLVSNQRALTQAKRATQAGLLELRLFQDDPRLVLRVVGDLFVQQGRYLRHALVPLLWAVLPLALLLAHLDPYYGREALHVGATAVVTVRIRADSQPARGIMRPSLALEGPPGLRVETPPVWAPALREAAWRIRAEREGDFMLHVIVDYARIERRVRVSRGLVAASTVRPPPRILDAWLHPAEAPIPASVPVEAIAIAYPVRNIDVFGATLPWLVVLFLLSTLFALLGSRVFRITL